MPSLEFPALPLHGKVDRSICAWDSKTKKQKQQANTEMLSHKTATDSVFVWVVFDIVFLIYDY